MNNFWTLEKIKSGFNQFQNEFGRLPTAPEIDKLDYLPSSKHIQRKFGGLEKVRILLGYKDTHFGKGVFRSKIGSKSNTKGREIEMGLEKILRRKFGEVFVHAERIFDNSKNRIDFYVYTPDGNFGIDVFYSETMNDIQKNINLKIDKYVKFPHQLFFVVGNDLFEQEALDVSTKNKKRELPQGALLITLKKLMEIIDKKGRYPEPLIQTLPLIE